ncbi:EAL domain-containing protein [Caminibacter profundus]
MKFYACEFSEENIKNVQHYEYKDLLITIFSGIVNRPYILNVIKILKSYFPKAKIIGTTTAGEIINSNIEDGKCILGFYFFEKSEVKTKVIEFGDNFFEVGKNIAKELFSSKSKLMITFMSGINVFYERVIEGIKFINDNVPVIGSIAGDNLKFRKSFVFDEKRVYENAILGCVIDSDDLIVTTSYIFGWRGIGKSLRVTKSKNNIVYELENQKALDIYKYYFGEYVDNYIKKIGLEIPLIKNEYGVKLARAVIDVQSNALVFGGCFKEGDKVQFGIIDNELVFNEAKSTFEKFLKNKVEVIIAFYCVARKYSIFNIAENEIKILKNVPNIGFFGYGEIYNEYFFHHTGCYVGLSEGGDVENKNLYLRHKKFDDIHGLIHLINMAFKELDKKLYFDKVTGLGSKFLFERDLSRKPFGGVLFDIRKFSSINDRYGEKIGDEILESFSKILCEKTPNKAKVYRISGDNFFILFFEEENLVQFASSIINYFYRYPLTVRVENEEIKIDIDIVAAVVEREKDIKIKADLALHYAKHHNIQLIKYSKSLEIEKNIENELKTISFVKVALKEKNIVPVFQKIEKKIPTYEALVRIQDKDRLVSPFEFLDSIRGTRYYHTLTKLMINKTFEYMKDKSFNFSINFSYKDIKNISTVDYLLKNIKEYNLNDRLIIELIETDAILDFDSVKEFIDKMRENGVKIAIDDFGSGYSNFVYLSELRPDIIKIDGSLIKDLDVNENLINIVLAIVNFAKSLGIETVAEYVKNKKVYDICKSLGIDGFQGFYIHKPSKDI